MERNTLVGGTVINTHDIEDCRGKYCTIHNMSDHHMVKWTQMWDEANRRMMRICKHNIAHIDPDEISTNLNHHCDDCCIPESQFIKDIEELVATYSRATTVRREKSTGRLLDI
jgi:hypothetical protein